jgi:hypothetical protein
VGGVQEAQLVADPLRTLVCKNLEAARARGL